MLRQNIKIALISNIKIALISKITKWKLYNSMKKLTSAKDQVTNAEAVNAVFTEAKTSAGVQTCQIFLKTQLSHSVQTAIMMTIKQSLEKIRKYRKCQIPNKIF